MNPYKNQT